MTISSTPARYLRETDRLPGNDARVTLGPLDPEPVLGTWLNSNHRTWGIAQLDLSERDGRVWIHVLGADPPDGKTHDWGEAVADQLYTAGPLATQVCGYAARFDLGHARSLIQANMNHGLTILAAFTTFTDGSGRSNFMSREFYYRQR
jgi:hypothetical protein